MTSIQNVTSLKSVKKPDLIKMYLILQETNTDADGNVSITPKELISLRSEVAKYHEAQSYLFAGGPNAEAFETRLIEMKKENEQLKEKIEELEKEVSLINSEEMKNEEELAVIKKENEQLEDKIGDLENEIDHELYTQEQVEQEVEEKVAELKKEIEELKKNSVPKEIIFAERSAHKERATEMTRVTILLNEKHKNMKKKLEDFTQEFNQMYHAFNQM